ncbi:hypothetical protein U1Q18_005097 [Sarracenia purpurea var. burkii]
MFIDGGPKFSCWCLFSGLLDASSPAVSWLWRSLQKILYWRSSRKRGLVWGFVSADLSQATAICFVGGVPRLKMLLNLTFFHCIWAFCVLIRLFLPGRQIFMFQEM